MIRNSGRTSFQIALRFDPTADTILTISEPLHDPARFTARFYGDAFTHGWLPALTQYSPPCHLPAPAAAILRPYPRKWMRVVPQLHIPLDHT